jgi:hypothetical protein
MGFIQVVRRVLLSRRCDIRKNHRQKNYENFAMRPPNISKKEGCMKEAGAKTDTMSRKV